MVRHRRPHLFSDIPILSRAANRLLLLVLIISMMAACATTGCARKPSTPGASSRFALQSLPGPFDQPLLVTHSPSHPEALFVVEKTGRIRVVIEGTILPQPLLDLQGHVSGGYEQGLLGLAFHPQFDENGLFFVNYTDQAGNTQIVRYKIRENALVADPASRKTLLTISQPAANHNGGMIAFGPDGYLYIGTGDGGGAGDPRGNAQNLMSHLGKLLRLDVDRGDPYGIPPDNPFANNTTAVPEIWALGLRNPWRLSFDRLTGDLYIADVGQNGWEEVSIQPATSPGGENYGWNRMEGTHCYPSNSTCNRQDLMLPVIEYSHSAENGCSITGGYMYRGSKVPELTGKYLFADYCSGRIWAATPSDGDALWSTKPILESALQISSFGEDAAGELYVTDLRGGRIYQLVATEFQ